MRKAMSFDTHHVVYTRAGAGPAVVLLHPIGVDRSWWSDYVHDWQDAYDVIAVDFRGHGESGPIAGPISLSDLAADVAAILRYEQVGPAALVGVSMGGMVAQRLAIEHSDLVRGMILSATAATFPDEMRARVRARGDTGRAGAMSEVVEETLARWFLPDTKRPDLVDKCRARLLADDWHSWSACWEAISKLDNLSELSNVRAKTLVVASELDASGPVGMLRQLAEAVAGAEFVVVRGAAHFGAFESKPDFEPVFRRFLSSLP